MVQTVVCPLACALAVLTAPSQVWACGGTCKIESWVRAGDYVIPVGTGASGPWEPILSPDPNLGGEITWSAVLGEADPTSGISSTFRAGFESGQGCLSISYVCNGCYNGCSEAHNIIIAKVVDIDPNKSAVAVDSSLKLLAVTEPTGYGCMDFIEMSATDCNVVDPNLCNYIITRSTPGTATVTAHCGTSSASRSVKFVGLDGAPDANVALSVSSNATASKYQPGTWVACWQDSNDAWVEITANLTPGCSDQEAREVLSWNIPQKSASDPWTKRYISLKNPARTSVTAWCGNTTASLDILVISVDSIRVSDADTPQRFRRNPPDANDLYLPEREVPIFGACAPTTVSVSVSPLEGLDYVVGTVDGDQALPSKGSFGGSTGSVPVILRILSGNRDFTFHVGVDLDGSARLNPTDPTQCHIDCCEQQLTAHVVAVQQVEWVGVDPGDGQTNLSGDNGSWHGGGWRLFPDQNASTGPLHNYVRAKATLTHSIPDGQPVPFLVYFRVFDMDDPTYNYPSQYVDPYDAENVYNGEDNRGGPGEIVGGSVAEVKGQNFGEIEYTIPTNKMYAGNNFKVLAHTSDTYVSDVVIDTGPTAKGLDLKRSTSAAVPVGLKSPFLSIWRRLNVETDSMDRPLRAQGQNMIRGLTWSDPTPEGTTQYRVYVEQAGWMRNYLMDPDNEFARGVICLMSPSYPSLTYLVDSSEIQVGMDYVIVGCANWTGSTIGTYDMCDDDCDMATFQAGQYTSTVGSGNHLGIADLSWMQDRFGVAYVEPIHLPQYSSPGGATFLMNTVHPDMMDLWTRFTPLRALPVSTPSYWTVQVISAFQPEREEDGDPTLEFDSGAGTTKGISTHSSSGATYSYLGSAYTGMAAVFREVVRDGSLSEPLTVVHEVAHTLGCPHTPQGIMKSTNQGDWFTEDSVAVLRTFLGP